MAIGAQAQTYPTSGRLVNSGTSSVGHTTLSNSNGVLTLGGYLNSDDIGLSATSGITLIGGTLSLSSVGTSGTYGDATHTAAITTNAAGQVVSVTSNAITPAGIGADVSGAAAAVAAASIAASGGTGTGITLNGTTTIGSTITGGTNAQSTFSASAPVFQGSNITMPNQTLTGANSVMTERTFLSIWAKGEVTSIGWGDMTAYSSSSDAWIGALQPNKSWQMYTGTSASSSAYAYCRMQVDQQDVGESNGNFISFAAPRWLSVKTQGAWGALTGSSTMRVIEGGFQNPPFLNNDQAFGFQCSYGNGSSNNTISILTYNGSWHSTAVGTVTTPNLHRISLYSDGAGNVTLYVDGSAKGSVTNGPTGTSSNGLMVDYEFSSGGVSDTSGHNHWFFGETKVGYYEGN